MTELNLVPECEIDTRIVQIVANISKLPNHQKGHGNVANKMLYDLENLPALGIIDEDRLRIRKAQYLSEFKLLKTENDLMLQKHYERSHYLILIKPAAEKWLLQNAAAVAIVPENLGDKLIDLARFTKRKTIHKNQDFYNFIKKLIRNQAPGITTLKTWVEEFMKDGKIQIQ